MMWHTERKLFQQLVIHTMMYDISFMIGISGVPCMWSVYATDTTNEQKQ